MASKAQSKTEFLQINPINLTRIKVQATESRYRPRKPSVQPETKGMDTQEGERLGESDPDHPEPGREEREAI